VIDLSDTDLPATAVHRFAQTIDGVRTTMVATEATG